jgi:hypothetical protein
MVSYIPQYDRTKVLTGMARCFLQKLTPTSVPALPLDTVALNGAWPATGVNIWVPVGATEEGMTLRFQRSTQDIVIEEQLTPVDVVTTGVDMSMAITLDQDTIDSMIAAYGGGTAVVTAAGVGITGKTVLTIGSDLDSYAFGFEAKNSYGMARRVLVPLVKSVGQAETAYRRAANKRMYATSFRTLCAPEEVIVTEITAPATA